VLKWVGLTTLTLIVLGGIAVTWAYNATDIPSPNDLALAQTSIIYYSDGKTEMGRLSDPDGDRESVPLTRVPDHVQKALLAAEDRQFYTQGGISPSGIASAIWSGITGGPTQGGSTITQQYVKNYFLTQDQTISRKAKEIIISIKVDGQLTKDQILESYLNTIYYGRGAYGVQNAARAYFGKDVSKLTVAEGAVLASVIRGPSLYDPALGAKQRANLTERFAYVLDGMVTEGWLTTAERAATTMPKIAPAKAKRSTGGTVGYLIEAVRQELTSDLKLTDEDILRGGLRVTTTIDKSAQAAAVKAVKDNFLTGEGAKDVHIGMAAVRPGDGAVVAMYGGADYLKQQLNDATQADLDAGSTFKPFGLIGALNQGISTHTRYNGYSPMRFPEFPDPITNYGGQSFGRVDLRYALAKSINTVYMQLNIESGPKATMDAAVSAGIPKDTTGLNATYTNILGTASPHVLDIANAYATIAAQGQRARPYVVAKVTSSALDVDYQVKKSLATGFSKDVAADVIDAMENVTSPAGFGNRAQQIGRASAGKTGTAENRKAVWWAGFVPQLSVAVGIYKETDGVKQPLRNIPGYGDLAGAGIPLSVWIDFMNSALTGVPVVDFPKRVGIGDDKAPTYVPSPSSSTTTSAPTTTTPVPTTTTPAPTTTTPAPTTTSPSPSTTPKPSLSNPSQTVPPAAAPAVTATSPGVGPRVGASP
jgi:membrane peptidoglycan carboxypeptidase